MTDSQARWQLVDELSRKLIEMYDAAEDYSEGQLDEGFQQASEADVHEIARDVFEGGVAMVIDELLTTDVGLEILYRINAHRVENKTNDVTATNRIRFVENPDSITVISTNFNEPQPGDYRGVPLAHIPYCGIWSHKRAKAIAEAVARYTIENPPEA